MKITIREGKAHEPKRLRVCAYCRVSTDEKEQENSLENQRDYYEKLIKSNPEYDFAGIYYDLGKSGYKENRPEFQRMLSDCRLGKIDFIITKSLSRFARNTNTVLKVSRELKSMGIGIFFELQNINTLSSEGEVALTVIAAFAQAESENASALAKLVYRRKYENGEVVQYLERSFGYSLSKVGGYEVATDEAKWVKKIYEMAAGGYTVAAIKRYLNDNNVKTAKGCEWSDSAVFSLLENEIYKGDYIMHKHYVNEERKLVKNKGEVDSWYIENDHKPIVSKKLWQKAQDAISKKREYLREGSYIAEFNEENYPYMKKIYCAECGYPLMRRVYSDGNRLNWGCSGTKRYGKEFCKGINVPDSVIRDWDFEGDIYIKEKSRDKGFVEFSFLKSSTWHRWNKKKRYEPKVPRIATKEDYPYMGKIYCGECGYHLTRHVSKSKVTWICSGNKHKGSTFCKGTRIDDAIVREHVDFDKDTYIKERRGKYGKKDYSYTSQKPKGINRD